MRRRRKNPSLRDANPALFRDLAVAFRNGRFNLAYWPDKWSFVPVDEVIEGGFFVVSTHDPNVGVLLASWIRLTMTTPGRRNREYERYIDKLVLWAMNQKNWIMNEDARAWLPVESAPVFHASNKTYKLAMAEF